MGKMVYTYKDGQCVLTKKEGPFPIVEHVFSCKEHGDFTVSKHADEFDGPEPCPKCGNPCDANINSTPYLENTYMRDNWRKTLSTEEHAKVLMGERDPY